MASRPARGSVVPPSAIPESPVLHDPIYFAPGTASNGLQIRELFDLLLRGKWIILAALLAVAIPVTIYTMLQPSVYSAYSLLLVHKQDESLADVMPGGVSASFWRSERNLGNELLVLRQSEALADSAARVLMQFPRIPSTGETPTILQVPEGEELTPEYVGARLQGGYVVANMEGADVDAIRVTAVSTIPAEAAMIADIYANAFVKRTRESSRAATSASREFLEEQLQTQAQRLDELDGAVRDFMMSEGAVDLDEASRRLVNQVAELQGRRDEALIDIRMKQATIGQLETELGAIEPRLAEFVASGAGREIQLAQERAAELSGRLETIYLRNPDFRTADQVPDDVQTLRDEIAQIRGRVSDLTQEYLEEAVPVGVDGNSAAMQRITTLRRQLAEEKITLSGLEAQRDVLNARIAEYEGELRAIPRQSIDLAQLQRDRQSTERLYTALEGKYQEARVAEQSELGYAEVIRGASIPHAPFRPNRERNILLGILLGLGLGVTLAILKTRLDHRIHRPDDLRDRGLPVIGTIPKMDALIQEDFNGAERITVDGQSLDTHLVALLNPMAVASESYRALRTSIQFSRPDVMVETILVTSGSPSEGKSVTSANLAIVMAQAGRRVLLIDADLRRPTVHKKLGVPREPGLVQLLFQDEPFNPEVYRTVVDDLYVIPAGAKAPNPSELLGSKAMRDLVATFREEFDVIIFDAPPVLAATDAVLLSTQCDATVLVASAGATKDYDLDHAVEQLHSVGAELIGTVLNGFDVSKAYGYKYKYQYRYGSMYGYGHDGSKAA